MSWSRRKFLACGVGIGLVGGRAISAEGQSGSELYADKAAADTWMRQWMDKLGAVQESLHLGRFADAIYFLRQPIGWKPNPRQAAHEVRVPVGFVTDFASIPRVFWSVLPPDGLYTYPAIVHDYLYWEQNVSRDEADIVLRYAMEDFRVPTATIETIYAGVRTGGSFAWNGNAARKASGEKRILRCFPQDPTIRWEEWRVRPEVC